MGKPYTYLYDVNARTISVGNFIKDVGRFRFRGYLGERIEGAHTLFVPIPKTTKKTFVNNSVKDIVMQFNFRIAQVESEE